MVANSLSFSCPIDILPVAVLHTISENLSANSALDNLKTTPTFVCGADWLTLSGIGLYLQW